jgi:type II secretory pathway pseudopilin PulG
MAHARTVRSAYTLAEVLAALVLMGVVVVVALQGMKVASRAGLMGERKVAAARVAERVINELLVTDQLSRGASSGTYSEGGESYPWKLSTQTWSQDSMTLVTITVSFTVQGEDFDVSLSTLYDATASSSSSSTTTTSSSTGETE